MSTRWTVGLVTLTDEPGEAVLAQYNPAERWNGWLCPWLDALAVVEVVEALNRGYGYNGEGADGGLSLDWQPDGALVVTDHEYNEPEVLPPDGDGLYPLGAWGWVWHEATPPEVAVTAEGMKGRDIQPGDVFSEAGSNWMVRDVGDGRIRLSAGRTDSGAWYEVKPDGRYDVYRPGQP